MHLLRTILVLISLGISFTSAEEQPSTLTLASRLAQAISGDDDIASAKKLEVVEALLARGQADEAKALAETIVDYRKSIGLLYWSNSLLQHDAKSTQIDEVMTNATRQLPKAQPAGANAIRTQLAILAQKRGDAPAAKKFCEAITDKETRAAAELLVAIEAIPDGERLDLDQWKSRIKEVAKNAPFPGAIPAARTLALEALKVIESKDATEGQRDLARKQITDADQLAQLSGVSYAESILPVAERLLVTEESHIANRLILQAASEVRGMPPVYEMKSILSASLARCWQISGQTVGALALLKEGEDFAMKVQPMEQPKCLAALAQAWRIMPADTESQRLIEKAVTIASENPNPRVRVLAALDICLSFDRAGQSLPPELAGKLKELASLQ